MSLRQRNRPLGTGMHAGAFRMALASHWTGLPLTMIALPVRTGSGDVLIGALASALTCGVCLQLVLLSGRKGCFTSVSLVSSVADSVTANFKPFDYSGEVANGVVRRGVVRRHEPGLSRG